MCHFKSKLPMKDYLLDTIRTTITAIILLISWQEIELILKVFIAFLIAVYWVVKIYKATKE